MEFPLQGSALVGMRGRWFLIVFEFILFPVSREGSLLVMVSSLVYFASTVNN